MRIQLTMLSIKKNCR